jgi:hypothetical protein
MQMWRSGLQTDMTPLLDGCTNWRMEALMGWLLCTTNGRMRVLALTNTFHACMCGQRIVERAYMPELMA